MSNHLGGSLCLCSGLFFFIFSGRLINHRHTHQGAAWSFSKGRNGGGEYCHFVKKKKETKSTHSISNVQESLHTFCAGESICALQASKVLPVWPAPVFLSQWFQPHGPTVFFILVPEETRNSLPTAVLSCALSATAAVM